MEAEPDDCCGSDYEVYREEQGEHSGEEFGEGGWEWEGFQEQKYGYSEDPSGGGPA